MMRGLWDLALLQILVLAVGSTGAEAARANGDRAASAMTGRQRSCCAYLFSSDDRMTQLPTEW